MGTKSAIVVYEIITLKIRQTENVIIGREIDRWVGRW